MTEENIFEKLKKSTFRRRFHLNEKDRKYITDKGMDIIKSHAYDFIKKRLSAAFPINDGKQTPMRGHPVFTAQHATGSCCRKCLYKWHHIPAGIELNYEQQEYIVNLIMEWIKRELS